MILHGDSRQGNPRDDLAGLLLTACDVGRLRAFRPILDFELHGLSLSQGPETRALNRRIMNKHVGAAIRRGDKTITF